MHHLHLFDVSTADHENPPHGAAGFIGMHEAQLLLARGDEVLGLDNLNDYYDPAPKQARLAQLLPLPGFRFVQPGVHGLGAGAWHSPHPDPARASNA